MKCACVAYAVLAAHNDRTLPSRLQVPGLPEVLLATELCQIGYVKLTLQRQELCTMKTCQLLQAFVFLFSSIEPPPGACHCDRCSA